MAGSLKELSEYRLSRANEDLLNAKVMLEENRFRLALNRSYYAIFHAMRAVNVLDKFDSSKHSGVIAYFNRYHVKTGDFPKKASKIIRNASEMREQADYEDFFVVTKQEAAEQVQFAKEFVDLVTVFLAKESS